ncbi:MAG: hypothetical protein U9Q06_01730, partial [Nanoarchaeota archaeon]|nr:hypothetical protein [Nanoarchaeota archaeon]
NRETKQMVPLEKEYKFRPEHLDSLKKGGMLFTPEAQLASINETEWENKMTELATFEKHANEIIGAAPLSLRKDYQNAVVVDEKVIDGLTNKELPKFSDRQKSDYYQMRDADIFLKNVELNFTSAFHKAYKYGTEKQKKELWELSNKYKENMDSLREGGVPKNGKVIEAPQVFGPVRKKQFLREAINDIKKITSHRQIENNGKIILDKNYGAPKIYEEVETFAMNKAANTFGNLAMKSYDKFGGNAPVIAIENFMPGTAFSSAKKMKELVDSSRKNFVNQLIKEENLSESEAKKIAEKQLGVTWDVGHLNMIKKKGFTDEDVLAETKKITEDKTMVKHVHLTDNFGFADSHLAPGMGNVPFKRIMEQLEKTGRIDEMRKIVEAGGFVQHFKKSPHGMSMAAFGSPIYGMAAGPYWNQVADMQGSYFGGYGTLNPQQHHSMYGSGFTTMPIDLGGQMPGDQSRFGGTPMA